jgi:hypothetical protein
MKLGWIAVVVLAGCVGVGGGSDMDATGTAQMQLTYTGGNCAKAGSEPFVLFFAKNGYGSYDITQAAIGQTISGSVFCGSRSCDVTFFKTWSNNANDSLSLDGMLTIDDDMVIDGSGKYSMFGFGVDCEHFVTFAGALQ